MDSQTINEGRPMRADARRNRERVLTAAREAFAEHGGELSMEELARRAEVGVGTLYRHFPSKGALLDALIVDNFGPLAEAAEAARDRDDPWQAFNELIWMGAEMQVRDIGACEAMMARKAQTQSDAVASVRARLEGAMAELIARSQAAGDMRPDFTPSDLPLFFASLTGALRTAHDHPDVDWRRHLQFQLDGLRAAALPATAVGR
jgi:AcrR family transcriptional regulator